MEKPHKKKREYIRDICEVCGELKDNVFIDIDKLNLDEYGQAIKTKVCEDCYWAFDDDGQQAYHNFHSRP